MSGHDAMWVLLLATIGLCIFAGIIGWIRDGHSPEYAARNAMNNAYASAYEKAVQKSVRPEVLVDYSTPGGRMKEVNDAVRLAGIAPGFAFQSWRVASERAWGKLSPATCDWCGSDWVADKFHPGSCGECGAGGTDGARD